MRVKLGELGKIITGNTPKTSETENYNSNDICFIKPSDISEIRYKIGYSLLTKKHYKLFRIYNRFYMFLKKLKNSK